MCTVHPTVICSVESCRVCSSDPGICEECEDGFVEDGQSACVRGGGMTHVFTGK